MNNKIKNAVLLTIVILTLALLNSCKTSKKLTTTSDVVEKTTTVDSSAYHELTKLKMQNKSLQTKLRYAQEEKKNTGIVFAEPCDGDTLYMPAKVVFDNGKLKSAEGRILSVNEDLVERTEELYDAHVTIDELELQNDSLRTELAKAETIHEATETLDLDKKSSPVPLFGASILVLLLGHILEYKLGVLKRIISLFKK